MSPILIDIILVAILALFLFAGIRRGLISSLAGFLSVIIALVGAVLLARALTPTVSQWIAPRIETMILEKVEDTTSNLSPGVSLPPESQTSEEGAGRATESPESDDTSSPLSVTEDQLVFFLKQIGLYDSVAKYIAESTSQQMTQAGTAISSALALSISSLIAFWVVLILSFIVLRILLAIAVRALNLAARLPVLHLLNQIGGGIFGLVQGVVVLFILAWLLRFFGTLIPEDIVEQTVVLRFLVYTNPTALLPKL